MSPARRQVGQVAVWVLSLALTGCVTDQTGSTYSATQVGRVQSVQFGTVVDVSSIKIEGTQGEIGGLAGSAIGGVALSETGNEIESTIASILGAVAGGVVGHKIEKKLTQKDGVELTIRLENGTNISIVQESEEGVDFRVGDQVKVLSQWGSSRVTRWLQ